MFRHIYTKKLPIASFFIFLFFIEVWSVCNVVSVSSVQHTVSVTQEHTYMPSHIIMGHYKIVNVLPCAL